MIDMKRKGWRIIVVYLSLAASTALVAGYWLHGRTVDENRELDVATGYWKTGAYAEAIPRLWSLANKGNKAAHRQLAHLYSSGLGVPRDRDLAKFLYLVSQDDPGATFHHLGKLFDGKVSESGLQIQKDEAEAIYWYYAAAVQGHREARLVISQAYRDGAYGLPRDASKAEYWRILSANDP